jgi:thiamine kinase-like enzyme
MNIIENRCLRVAPPEKLREKLMYNTATGKEYVAYYPVGYEVTRYFNSGSQVNVSEIVHRRSGAVYLLKNKDPRSEGPSDAINREIMVSQVFYKVFKEKDAMRTPRTIEAAWFKDESRCSYIIEEKKSGYEFWKERFNDLSKSKQKEFIRQLVRNMVLAHFCIPDKILRATDFCIDKPKCVQDSIPDFKHSSKMRELLRVEKLSVVHFDLQSPNILFDGHQVSIIDWGKAGVTDRRYDFQRLSDSFDRKFMVSLCNEYINQCAALKIGNAHNFFDHSPKERD